MSILLLIASTSPLMTQARPEGKRGGDTSTVGQPRRLDPVGFWVTAGIGPTTPYEFGVVATTTVRYRRLLVRARYASAAELLGDWDEDLGILIGMALTPESRRAQVAVSAGVGRVNGSRGCVLCGSQSESPTAGFLMDAEARVALTRFMGVTAYLFGDLNARESFGGLAFGVFVGRL